MTYNDTHITTSELSAETGYSIRAIQQWCSDGRLTAVKFGRDYVIKRSDWDVFSSEHNPVKRTRPE